MEPLVEALASAIDPWLDRPFALFGHSNGALVAFELVRALRARGRPGPVHLFASARVAPQFDGDGQRRDLLSEDQFVELLRRFGGTPSEVLADPELMSFLLPALRSDFALNDTYAHSQETPLACDITAYGGTEDLMVDPVGVVAWKHQTTGAFNARFLPGGHFFLAEPASHVALLADIDLRLRRSAASPSIHSAQGAQETQS